MIRVLRLPKTQNFKRRDMSLDFVKSKYRPSGHVFLSDWAKHSSYFSQLRIPCESTGATGRSSSSTLDFCFPQSARRRPVPIPTPICKGRRMNKRLIWVEGDDFSGWCCANCQWGMTAPHLDSTVAALAFNRLAQETFEKHNCLDGTRREAPGAQC